MAEHLVTITELSLQQWQDQYKPIKNPRSDLGYDHTLYDTWGTDHEVVLAAEPDIVWTLLEEDDYLWISNGRHYVNRVGYFITEVPWLTDIQVMLAVPDPEDQTEDE